MRRANRAVCLTACVFLLTDMSAGTAGEVTRLPFSYECRHRTPAVQNTSNQSRTGETVGAGRSFGVFINATLYGQIKESIDTYIADLESDGWQVVVYAAEGGTSNKSDANDWTSEDFITELEAARQLRDLLGDEHNQGMVGCILIGELPAGWVEAQAGSGTGSPVDLFFRDMDSQWDDTDGNGLLDEISPVEGDCKPEIWMSRLYANSLEGDEVAKMTNYFRRNHAYRIGELTLPKRALDYVDDDFSSAGFFLRGLYDEIVQVNDNETTTASDYKARLSEGYDLIRVTVHGYGWGHGFLSNGSRSDILYSYIKNNDPRCFFYDIVSCSTFKWWDPNYIDGWYVFSRSHGLASWGKSSYGSAGIFYDTLDRGRCLGEAQFECLSRWVTDTSYLGGDGLGDFGMFGDPTLVLRQPPIRPTIIYVDDDAVGGRTGLNWEDAYHSLQDALATASWGTEIQVARGVYKPDQGGTVSASDRGAGFRLRNGVVIKGGYAGCIELDPNMRDVRLYETVLSGDIGIPDANSDNAYHVVSASSVGAAALLDGFTVTGGYADSNDANSCGAGVYLSRSSPSIVDCIIVDNHAKLGGGMFIENDSMPTLIDCQFNHNSAIDGGGIANKHYSDPTLDNCIFSANEAYSTGGGMRNVDNCTPLLTNCAFNNNRAIEGGGMFNRQYSDPTLNDCDFRDNSSENGGGMANYLYSQPTLAFCEFHANSANLGGGMFNDRASPILANCRLRENQAETHGGGMYNTAYCETLLTNCIFTRNEAGRHGGAMYNHYSNPSLAGCVLSSNTAVSNGGGVYNAVGNSVLANCTITENVAVRGGAMFSQSSRPSLTNCILWGDEPDEIYDWDSVTVVSYSDIAGAWPSETNMDGDPCFANPGYWDNHGTPNDPTDDFWIDGDFHLQSQAGRWDPIKGTWKADKADSLCIDTGDPFSPVGDEPEPNGGRINMGAYGGTAEASKSL